MSYTFASLEELKSKSRLEDFDGEYDAFKSKITDLLNQHPDCTPIYIAVTGSVSYGLDLEKSDIDGKGIFIQDLNSLMKELKIGQAVPFIYKSSFSTKKEDVVFYELGRYIELIHKNNPNIMEFLENPEDCIVYKHEIWDVLCEELKKYQILTKKCYYSFHSYAVQQLQKAKGLNKKINVKNMSKIRKSPLDFCHVITDKNKTVSLRKYLELNNIDQKMCGLARLNNIKDIYEVYYDVEAAKCFSKYEDAVEREAYRQSKLAKKENMGLGYKGIIKENDENLEVSNEIRISSIPKGETRLFLMQYSKDSYNTYIKDYNEYWEWVENRNEVRYNDNTSGGQNYDGKNMSHCMRLLYMAREIAEGKGVVVRRGETQREELLAIKKGLSTYEDILKKCDEAKDGLKELYDNSGLPEEPSFEDLSNVLKSLRKTWYELD